MLRRPVSNPPNSSLYGMLVHVVLFSVAWIGSSSSASADEASLDLPIDESAVAGVVAVPIIGSQVIMSESGRSRLLLQPGDFSQIDGEFVISATLWIPLSGAQTNQDLPLRVYAIDRAWTVAAATWNSPWAEPGGDVFRDYPTNVEIPKGAVDSFIELDVSEAVRAMADRDVGMNGFLMTIPDYLGEGLDSEDVASLGSMSEAKLYVDYRRISALGFPREGSKALWKRTAEGEKE